MKKIPKRYFLDIESAYQEDTASSCTWAESKTREIIDYLLFNEILITDHNQEHVVIDSKQELSFWLTNHNIIIPLNTNYDIIYLIEKLNTNIKNYEVVRLDFSKSMNQFSGKEDIHIKLSSSNGDNFYAGFKDVEYISILDFSNPIVVSDLVFQFVDPNEIELNIPETHKNENYIFCGTYHNVDKIYIVCRELET